MHESKVKPFLYPPSIVTHFNLSSKYFAFFFFFFTEISAQEKKKIWFIGLKENNSTNQLFRFIFNEFIFQEMEYRILSPKLLFFFSVYFLRRLFILFFYFNPFLMTIKLIIFIDQSCCRNMSKIFKTIYQYHFYFNARMPLIFWCRKLLAYEVN